MPNARRARRRTANQKWSVPARTFLVGAAVVVAVIGLGWVTFTLTRSAQGTGSCFKQSRANLASSQPALWSPRAGGATKKIAIALDDFVNDPRRGAASVSVRRTSANRRNRPLPPTVRVGAFVLGGTLTDGTRDLGFPVAARATRTPDGRALDIELCALRPERRSLSRPGRYSGTVRVAGQRVESVDLPVELTIKGARTETLLFGFVIAVIGGIAGAANSKPADVTNEEVEAHRKGHAALALLPFAGGIIAGLLAGLVIYWDDPTFGAERGADTAKLLAATFAAATGGLTIAAPATRVLRKKLAKTPSRRA